jgi:hypothetical protein
VNIHDFITQEEIEDLPDDDPQAAFVLFVRIAQRRLGERTREINAFEEGGYAELEDARYGFMNVTIAAAKKYGIEPFLSLSVPRLENFNSDAHRQFKADLDHYMTQLLLDNSSRAKRDSVLISADLKTTIHTYVFHLREVIEKADDINEARRVVLLRKLAEFETELEKKRLSLMTVMLLAITFLSAPGGIGATYDLSNKLVTNILRAVGEAKTADDEARRLPSAVTPMVISGPRKSDKEPVKQGGKSDLDDEIPF